MKKIFLALAIVSFSKTYAQYWANEDQYIQNFALYAVEEMQKYKIPASITIAQGLLESSGGQSKLARQGNNHFGIKCKEDWTGPSMRHTDDAPNECFRVYSSVRDSYEDHSKFLAYRKYYRKLFTLDPKDYKAWAFGLKKAGYATNPKYAYILINKIEKYKLHKFDDDTTPQSVYATLLTLYPDLYSNKEFMAKANAQNTENTIAANDNNTKKVSPTVVVPYKQTSYAEQVRRRDAIEKNANDTWQNVLVRNHPNGDRKYIIVPLATNVDFLAQKYDIRGRRIMRWNELESANIPANSIIFLESKSGEGNVSTYIAQQGDTMYSIAQKFAIKLHRLYQRNRMDEGQELQIGQVIYLQGRKPKN
ncbi:glucosaminidase domain-containing protein [Riemerella columbipharyngis]|uniref:Peptidoglycan hydrolase n=1 Tax=Riemerella columbipharyngis TaxID=1071918 RepID=A0A1G7BTX7_9FLAO|nr:glucosaminidase domain-containing protein [Riemerella columbipharyngis]SDE30422.1 Flagellum-specific peptidoglycan hydrolase FlgJ [Riemerella columbipharyngis]